jgi:hypothetical protein
MFGQSGKTKTNLNKFKNIKEEEEEPAPPPRTVGRAGWQSVP